MIIYDPDTATLDPNLPPVGSGLRWDEFVETIAATYELHFEQVSVLRVRLFELSAKSGSSSRGGGMVRNTRRSG